MTRRKVDWLPQHQPGQPTMFVDVPTAELNVLWEKMKRAIQVANQERLYGAWNDVTNIAWEAAAELDVRTGKWPNWTR